MLHQDIDQAHAEAQQLQQQLQLQQQQLQEAKAQYKIFSEKTKAKIEQKDQAIDALTMQVSQHIGTIVQLQQEQEQLQGEVAAGQLVVEGFKNELEAEKAEGLRRQLLQEEFVVQQQQQHAACIADLESQIAFIESSSSTQLQQQHAAAAAAAADAAAAAHQLAARLQTTMQASVTCDNKCGM